MRYHRPRQPPAILLAAQRLQSAPASLSVIVFVLRVPGLDMARSARCKRGGLVTSCLPSLFKHARAPHSLRDTPDNSSSATNDTVEPDDSVQGSIWLPDGLQARSYLTSDMRVSLREIMRTRPLNVDIIL
jgi:hypothetical protein